MPPLNITPQQQKPQNPPLPPHYNIQPNYERLTQKPGLRRHVLLAQDCVAIKFTRNHQNKQSSYYVQTDVVDAYALFKSFKSSNKKCHWNPNLQAAIQSLEYKGHVHPSTVLVSGSNAHTNVLRNAWARRILRDPPGFRAEFLGEVEEIVSQSVQQGQFAPLSDSLCWAISEITEAGKEAFIDSITNTLNNSFPKISQPPRDLIFQTLEKLIREQKIYQTSNGYFIVTPEVSSYISYSRSVTPQIYGRIYSDLEKQTSRYSTPWGSTPSVSNDEEIKRLFTSSLKRHSSMRVIRRTERDFPVPSMGARSLSFRLSKCNSMFESDKESDNGVVERVVQDGVRDKKRPSFFTRLFKFRCTSKQKPPKKWNSLPHNQKSSPLSSVSGIYASISQKCDEHSSLYELGQSETSR